ncbi:MAG: HAMP domain-containing sensor histidine kinase [Pseudoflavonifractor sp.]
MKSLYKRQFALMAGMILISFALLGAAFITLSYQYTVREKQDTIARNAEAVAKYTGQAITRPEILGGGLGSEKYKLYVTSVSEIADAYVLICTPSGEVVLSSGGELSYGIVGHQVPQSVLDEMNGSGAYKAMTALGGLFPEKRFVAGCPIVARSFNLQGEARQQQLGVAFVAAEASSITELWRAFSSIFFFTSVVVLCIAFITTSVTSLRQTKPLKEMAEAARKFGHGEFETRVEVGGRQDEVGELAESFNAMAESLAKSEAKRSEFVANISHELKTPMTTIAGFADGILDGTIPREREPEALSTISSETRRLSRLVRRMLDLSRLQSAENVTAQEQFDISELMVRVLVSLETKINARHLDIETHLPDESVRVWGDPDAITQVCYNLLDNAIKFSREGEVITLGVSPKGGKAHVSIRNVGETIPPGELNMLFDRFHKSDKSRSEDREGVGLGLYIVKTILNNHKENITVTSADGVTEFTFTLMLA